MRGLVAAFTGSIGKDCEVRNTKDGKPWISFTAVVDADRAADEGPIWVRTALFGPEAEALAAKLTKGAAVYVEGTLRLAEWVGRDGEKRSGLNVTASRIDVLGQIGRPREQGAA